MPKVYVNLLDFGALDSRRPVKAGHKAYCTKAPSPNKYMYQQLVHLGKGNPMEYSVIILDEINEDGYDYIVTDEMIRLEDDSDDENSFE